MALLKLTCFPVDLQRDFLKPLMEPLMPLVSLMGVGRSKLTDRPVNISTGKVL